MRIKSVDIKLLIEGLMADFYEPGGVKWRQVFEGEELQLAAFVGNVDAEAMHVTFHDSVRQVAPAGPFDAIACAQALMRVREWMNANPHDLTRS